MSDTREAILEQLLALLGSLSGVNGSYRNRSNFDSVVLPVALLLDGGEHMHESADELANRKGVKMRAALMVMQPEIYIISAPRDDVDNSYLKGVLSPIGEEWSLWRSLAQIAIVNDPTLISLVTTSGQLAYLGCDTSMEVGTAPVIQMRFEFTYPWFPPRG